MVNRVTLSEFVAMRCDLHTRGLLEALADKGQIPMSEVLRQAVVGEAARRGLLALSGGGHLVADPTQTTGVEHGNG
ncbi:MAG TPA: hypothetical protein VMY80_14040 [Anaerolineae bacterium]|nr:hypothetical protein [Anaerolineae bacterium]